MAKKKPPRSKRKKKSKKRKGGSGRSPSQVSSLAGMMGLGGGGEVPEGFRAVSMTQAMMEFADPLMEYVENGTVADPNDALQIGVALWNFASPSGVLEKESRKDLIKNISKTLRLTSQEAEALFNRMIERKAHLFPEEVQPQGAMTMFMRKETEYEIVPFDEGQLQLSEDPVPDTQDDRKLIDALLRMDQFLDEEAEYDAWESHFFSMADLFRESFEAWLGAKGCPETYGDLFPFCADLFLTFLYQYEGIGLRSVSKNVLDGFFMSFVMRKAIVKPPEYVYWPSALRLCFAYLAEKGYLKNVDRTLKSINVIEPKFIALVKATT